MIETKITFGNAKNRIYLNIKLAIFNKIGHKYHYFLDILGHVIKIEYEYQLSFFYLIGYPHSGGV